MEGKWDRHVDRTELNNGTNSECFCNGKNGTQGLLHAR